MTDCPFCDRIAAGEYESFSDDPSVVWFGPLKPVTPGHLLFVPVRHVADALADPYTTAITMEIASRWAGRQRAMALPEQWDCNLITSAGAAATQTVRHLHVHLVPRTEGDGLLLPWSRQGWRSFTEYAVAWGDDDPNGVGARGDVCDDEEDAAGHIQWRQPGAYVARRTVALSRWERVPEMTP